MAETHFQRVYRAKLIEVIEGRSAEITVGGCKSFEDYKHDTGYISGLWDALKYMEETQKDMESS